MRRQPLPHFAHGHGRGFRFRVAVDAGADAGKGHAGELVFVGQAQAVAVAAGQQRGLALVAAVPDWPHGVNDVAGRQPPGGGDDGLAGFAAALPGPNGAARFQNGRAAGAVNGPINPAAAEQAGVGGVNDGRYWLAGDVALHELDAGGKGRRWHNEESCNEKRRAAINALRNSSGS